MKKVSPLYLEVPDTWDGVYKGTISGYEIHFKDMVGNLLMFRVDDGIRGINIPVEVTIRNGNVFAVRILENHEH